MIVIDAEYRRRRAIRYAIFHADAYAAPRYFAERCAICYYAILYAALRQRRQLRHAAKDYCHKDIR